MVYSTATVARAVVAIAAHIPRRNRLGLFPGNPSEQLFRECSSYCELVSTVEQMPARSKSPYVVRSMSGVSASSSFRRRCAQAGGEHGRAVADGTCAAQSIVVPSDQTLDKLADLLNKARRVTLLCGSGCEGGMTS